MPLMCMPLMCLQDKGASSAVETQPASDSEFSLGGLPICRSLTRRKSMPDRAPAPSCTHPHSGGGSASSNTAAAAAAAMSFNNHGQRSSRHSRLITLSAVPTTQVHTHAHHASLHAYYRRHSRLIMPSTVPTTVVDMYTQCSSLRAYHKNRQSRLIMPSIVPTTVVDIYTDCASFHAYHKSRQSRLIMPSIVAVTMVDTLIMPPCLPTTKVDRVDHAIYCAYHTGRRLHSIFLLACTLQR